MLPRAVRSLLGGGGRREKSLQCGDTVAVCAVAGGSAVWAAQVCRTELAEKNVSLQTGVDIPIIRVYFIAPFPAWHII